MKRIDELAEKVAAARQSVPRRTVPLTIKDAAWLIRVARAAEMATGAYWGASNELEAMQELRAALENPDGL